MCRVREGEVGGGSGFGSEYANEKYNDMTIELYTHYLLTRSSWNERHSGNCSNLHHPPIEYERCTSTSQ